MGKLLLTLIVIAAAVIGGGYFNRTQCLSDEGPRAAVLGYVTAMKDKRFEDAYPFVTATMTDGKPVAEWAGLQRKMFEMGGVAIGEIDVRSPHRELKNIFMCAATAKVPNVLHAGDVLNNQGSTEFEIYNVVLEGGAWKIDSQETLFDEPMIHRWFPNDKIPDLKGTADQPATEKK